MIKQTTHNTENQNLPWFSHLLRHTARKRGGLILQSSLSPQGARWDTPEYTATIYSLTESYEFYNTHRGWTLGWYLNCFSTGDCIFSFSTVTVPKLAFSVLVTSITCCIAWFRAED